MDVERLEETLDYKFNERMWIEEALQVAGLGKRNPEGNKRLSQLGDSVLRMIILDDWYLSSQNCGAGNRIVSRVTSNECITNAARATGLDICIETHPSQVDDVVAPRVLVNTLFAVLAAVWLDSAHNFAITRGILARLNISIEP